MPAIKYDTLQVKVKSDSHAVSKADEIQIVDNLNRFFVGRGLYLPTYSPKTWSDG